MKKNVIARIILIIILFNLSSLTFAQTQIKEQANASIVFNASWGENDEQIGLIKIPEAERGGPFSFCINGKDFFLLDSVKNRVLASQKTEKILVVNNIKAWDIASDGGDGFFTIFDNSILHYDGKGLLKDSFSIPQSQKIIEGYGSGISVSKSKGLFYNNVDQKSLNIASGSAEKGFKAVDEKEAAKIYEGKESADSDISYFIKRLSGDDIRLIGFNLDGKDVITVKIQMDGDKAGAVLFKGQDNSGKLYIEVERIVSGKALLEVHAYSKNGERIKIYKLPNNYFTTVYKKTDISQDGSVYQLLTTPEGVQILKY